MKKILIFIVSLGLSISVNAQSRKYMSQFSHLQSYYNPALTGYEGSMLRGFVRNQWIGLEGAPKTAFFSAEVDFADFGGRVTDSGKNAMGLNVLHDQYGPFVETEAILSYSVRIRLSENTNVRLGSGINYNAIRLDGNNLTIEMASDPTISKFLNSFANMQILDFNLGMAITNEKYYLSYGVHHVNRGSIQRGDVFMERKPQVHVVQVGYRNYVTENVGIALNGMYRSQQDLPDNVELNAKVILKDKLWIGGGHRFDYANNVQLGMIFNRARIGYVYEMPQVRSYLLPNTTHEFLLTYSLFGRGSKMIW